MEGIEILESLTKTPGCVEHKMIKCGKKNCKCATNIPDFLHGPYYFYRFWGLEHGRYNQKRKYISYDTYGMLGKVLKYYRAEMGGSHGNFSADRQHMIKQLMSGIRINPEGLKAFEIKVQDVMDMISNP